MEFDDSFSFLSNFDYNIKYGYNENENSIETEYHFQYPDDYYKFLLMHFVRLKPNISRCLVNTFIQYFPQLTMFPRKCKRAKDYP